MISVMFDLLPVVVVYVLIGIMATALTGGRDSLSFGPPIVLVAWPAVLVGAAVGYLLMPFYEGDSDAR